MPSSPRLSPLHSSSSGSLTRKTCCLSLNSSKSLMRRPTPSVCLSQMAISTPSAECTSTGTDTDTGTGDHNNEQCPYSPISSSDDSCSPWGQFVDVIPPTTDDDSSDEESQSYRCAAALYSPGNSQNSYQPYYKPSRRSTLRKSSKGFLPGFILSIPTPSKPVVADDVLRALKQMHV